MALPGSVLIHSSGEYPDARPCFLLNLAFNVASSRQRRLDADNESVACVVIVRHISVLVCSAGQIHFRSRSRRIDYAISGPATFIVHSTPALS